jgi:hypothetical protein
VGWNLPDHLIVSQALSGMISECKLSLDYLITDDIDIMFEEKWRRSIRDYLTNLTPEIFLLYNALFDATPFRSECFGTRYAERNDFGLRVIA